MKKLHCLLLFFFWSLIISAQQKIKCDEAFASFEEKVNAGDYKNALINLDELRKSCRGFNEKMYTYAATMLTSGYEATRDEKEKKKLAADLIDVYTEHDKYYPQSNAVVKKAMLQFRLNLATEEEIFALLDTAYNSKKAVFSDHNAIETYFLLYLKKFQQDNGNVSNGQFVERYIELSSHIRYVSAKIASDRDEVLKKQETLPLSNAEKIFLNTAEASIESLSAVGENIDMLASKHIGCNALGEYYTRCYDSHKEDFIWLDAMVNTLLNNRCFKVEMLGTAVKQAHALRPGSQTAFNVATVALRSNNITAAATYFEESAQLEQDQKKKADIYYRIASVLRNSDMGKAKSFAIKSAEANTSSGKPYIFLAELYSSAARDCGLNEFEQKALLWLSIETVKKASVAEAKYQPTVASMVESYTKRLPTKKEVSAAGRKKGDKITYGCWINETVIIPNLK